MHSRTVVSYVPLLQYSPDIHKCVVQADRIIKEGIGLAKCCLWHYNDNCRTIEPIMCMHRAHEIYEHLVKWAKCNPVEMFDLYINVENNSYSILLAAKSERDAITVPLRFKTTQMAVIKRTMAMADKPLQKPMRLGLLDMADLSGDAEESAAKAVWVGPFDAKKGQPVFSNIEELISKLLANEKPATL